MACDRICLLPLGIDDPSLLDDIARGVEGAFHIPVARMPSMPVPDFAFSEARGQYHSTTILQFLQDRVPRDALRLLGITDVDLFVPQLNFVFGEAAVDGRVGVISLTRLRPEFYGKPPDHHLFVERAIKEAVHELGHTFGLRHCAHPHCVMFFSNNVEDTDRKSAEFCDQCGWKLLNTLRSLKRAA